jgi:hypothetical protein
MDRKLSQGFETPRYSYAEVERALAAVFNLDADRQRGALRGRLKHLQRLGLPGLESGKGKRVAYSFEQASQWLIALLMAQIGIDPAIIAKTVKASWKGLVPSVKAAIDTTAKRENPIYLGLRPRVMLGAWEEGPSLQVEMFRRFSMAPSLGPNRDELPHKTDADADNWLCVINFTRPLSHLELVLR